MNPTKKTRHRKIASYNYNPRQTLAQKRKKAYRRVFFITVVVSVISILILTNISNILSNIGNLWNAFDEQEELTTPETLTETQNNLLWTPEIDPLPKDTNQVKINITGQAYQGSQVELIFNGESIAVDDLDKDKKFEFTDLNLKSGENKIAVRSIKQNGDKSELSKEAYVTLDLKPPELEITAPQNKQKFSKDESRIKVQGKTELDAKLYINDHIVIIKNDGTFEYQVTLKEGENIIKIKALDEAGNETEEEIKVNYSSGESEED